MAVKWDINLGTIVGTGLTVGLPLFIWGYNLDQRVVKLDVKVEQSESFRAARTAQTDKNFTDVIALSRAISDIQNKQAVELTNLTYRMGQQEATATKNNEALNARMDRLSETLLGSVKSLSDYVAQLNVKMELTAQKIDALDVPRTRSR